MSRSLYPVRALRRDGNRLLVHRTLRAEPLEPRLVCSATTPVQELESLSLSNVATEAFAATAAAPVVDSVVKAAASGANVEGGLSTQSILVSAGLQASTFGVKDPALLRLVRSLDADGSISFKDMLAIFRSPAASTKGVVTKADLTDLRAIVCNATALNMPGYVRVLASNVVNGNRANGWYQGKTLGNLVAGNAVAKLNKLVGKWFLGADHPATGGYGYSSVSGSLFTSSGPSHNDEQQGYLGDCYLISALGMIADSSQEAIRNMFVDNGVDARTGVHTWTVRFFYNGTADYVTVDNKLPTSNGSLIFQGIGSSPSNPKGLWLALAEKAYAQWNQTGREGRDGRNSYLSIEGGWMANVDAQALGHAASSYYVSTTSDRNALIAAVTNNMAVTIGTVTSSNANGALNYGLYGNHAYGIIGYNSTAQTFTLYNPWGVCQPTKSLTWAELKNVCDVFTVANTSGTHPFGAGVTLAAVGPVLDTGMADQTKAAIDAAVSAPMVSHEAEGPRDAACLATWAVDAALAQQTPSAHNDFVRPVAQTSSAGTAFRGSNLALGSRADHAAIDFATLAVDEFFQTV